MVADFPRQSSDDWETHVHLSASLSFHLSPSQAVETVWNDGVKKEVRITMSKSFPLPLLFWRDRKKEGVGTTFSDH